MIDSTVPRVAPESASEAKVAAAGVFAGLTALFTAAACCVLPLAFAALGLGAGGLAVFVPYRWPLTLVALVIVAAGWALYLRKSRACASQACDASGRSAATLAMLSVATLAIAFSVGWEFIEPPLMRALGGT